ncbi:MAG TPA: hypothetical protein DG753_00140 [Clostridium sp.]|nr:hypothetical protein [Clostridium sp.]
MEKSCVDAVFGEMIYKHRWIKHQVVNLLGKEWKVTIAAKAYSGKMITEEQRTSYTEFMNKEKEIQNIVADQLLSYVSSDELNTENEVKTSEDLSKVVTPKTILFKQNGTTLVLFDYKFDEEHGLAVKVFPEVAVGVQDLFL